MRYPKKFKEYRKFDGKKYRLQGLYKYKKFADEMSTRYIKYRIIKGKDQYGDTIYKLYVSR